MREVVARDRNHPSIFAWVAVQRDLGPGRSTRRPRAGGWVARDGRPGESRSTRPGWSRTTPPATTTTSKTDLNTWHFYIDDYDRARRHVERVVAQTDEGSPFNYVPRYGQSTAPPPTGRAPAADQLRVRRSGRRRRRPRHLLGLQGPDHPAAPARQDPGLRLHRADRHRVGAQRLRQLRPLAQGVRLRRFVPGMTVADLNGADFVGLDCPPCQTLAPGAVFSAARLHLPLGPAPAGTRPGSCWRVAAHQSLGRGKHRGRGTAAQFEPGRYEVTEAGIIEARLPEEPCLVTVALWLEDDGGAVRARNYVNVDVHDAAGDAPLPRGRAAALRSLSGPATSPTPSWPTAGAGPAGPEVRRQRRRLGGIRAGTAGGAAARHAVTGLRLVFEAGARTASSRIGWKRIGQPSDRNYPQTEARKLPRTSSSRSTASSSARFGCPTTPRTRAAFSALHLNENFEYASYGFLTTLEADAETAQRILAAGNGERDHRALRGPAHRPGRRAEPVRRADGRISGRSDAVPRGERMSDPAPWPVLTRYDRDHLARIALPLGGIGTGTRLAGRARRPARLGDRQPAREGLHARRTRSSRCMRSRRAARRSTRVLEGPLDLAAYEGAFGSPARQPRPAALPRRAPSRRRIRSVRCCCPTRIVPLSGAPAGLQPAHPGRCRSQRHPGRRSCASCSRTGPTGPVTASVCGSVQNFIGSDGTVSAPRRNVNEFRRGAAASPGSSALARASTRRPSSGARWRWRRPAPASVTHRTAWANLSWSDSLLDFWDDFSGDGRLESARPAASTRRWPRSPWAGHRRRGDRDGDLSAELALPEPDDLDARRSRRKRRPASAAPCGAAMARRSERIGNYYATQYADAWEVAARTAADLPQLESDTLALRERLLRQRSAARW